MIRANQCSAFNCESVHSLLKSSTRHRVAYSWNRQLGIEARTCLRPLHIFALHYTFEHPQTRTFALYPQPYMFCIQFINNNEALPTGHIQITTSSALQNVNQSRTTPTSPIYLYTLYLKVGYPTSSKKGLCNYLVITLTINNFYSSMNYARCD